MTLRGGECPNPAAGGPLGGVLLAEWLGPRACGRTTFTSSAMRSTTSRWWPRGLSARRHHQSAEYGRAHGRRSQIEEKLNEINCYGGHPLRQSRVRQWSPKFVKSEKTAHISLGIVFTRPPTSAADCEELARRIAETIGEYGTTAALVAGAGTGLKHVSKRRRKQIARAGGKARWRKPAMTEMTA